MKRHPRPPIGMSVGGLALAALLVAQPAFGAVVPGPIPVSPGTPDRLTLVESACPTFSWNPVASASGQELVIYRLDEPGDSSVPGVVLRKRLPGAASSWTPSLDDCFERGAGYAWAVRSFGDLPEHQGASSPEASEFDGDWSDPHLFRVAAAATSAELARALELIRQYLAEGGQLPGLVAEPAAGETPARAATPSVAELSSGKLSVEASSFAGTAAAMRAEGKSVGLLGLSQLPDGAGVVAINADPGGGADLVLDGSAQGALDTLLSESGISVGGASFEIGNAADNLALTLDGSPIVTTATDQDALASLLCATGEVAKWNGASWSCAADEDSTFAAGNQLSLNGSTFDVEEAGLNADTLDGFNSTALLQKLEIDTEAELEALLGDVANVLTDGETAAAAAALSSNPADCPEGQWARGVDASGNAEGCTVDAGASDHGFGSANTGVGAQALISNTTGSQNTAAGYRALYSNTDGISNTASGARALYSNTTGTNNTANGLGSLLHNTEGLSNTATGSNALSANLTGSRNTASGVGALLSTTTSFDNTASGYFALSANTSGSYNTATGARALSTNTDGFRNTASGYRALRLNLTGSRNTAVGYRAGENATTGNDNVFLGSGAEGVAGESNTIRIGGTAVGTDPGEQNRTFINGIRGVPVGGEIVVIDAAGQLGSSTGGEGSGLDSDTVDGFHASLSATPNALLAVDDFGMLRVDIDGHATSATDSDTLDGYNSLEFLLKTEIDTEVELEALLGGVSNVLTDNENAATATALANPPTTCPPGQWAAGVDASGNAQGCTPDATGGSFDQITSSTNNLAQMVVGSGASLFTSGTGTIVATSAATAGALNADGTNCPAGQWAAGVDAAGNVQGCTAAGIDHGLADSNTRVGAGALANNSSGSGNTASGYRALYSNTNGFSNTATGRGALEANSEGRWNTASGHRALTSNTGGVRNTATGSSALYSNLTGSDNTALGANALASSVDGDHNTATGASALRFNVSGSRNTANGHRALDSNTDNDNTAIGFQALTSNTSGHHNTATGSSALQVNSIGSWNTATGAKALLYNIGGSNTATGYKALYSSTTGDANTANGAHSLAANTDGFFNTAIGFEALHSNTSGFGNTATGVWALYSNTDGFFNTAIGYRAGLDAAGSHNIFVGHGAEGRAGDSNTIRIGGESVGTESGEQNRTFINGIRGVTTEVADAIPVLIDGAGQLGTVSSSRRYKETIEEMGRLSDRVLELRPVTFRFKKAQANGEKPIQFGLIAEEVAEVFPELVVYDREGRPETVKYHLLSVLLLNELQKLHRLVQQRLPGAEP